jgi:hypothetical protein
MRRVNNYPLLIEFVPGTRISREPEVVPKLPILRNGPPGTSVVFGDGVQVPLPTDQIVFAEDGGGAAHVGFGGMSFEGMEGGQLVFFRVRDLQPEELLSPQRGRRMTLEPHMVASIAVDGRVVWPQ